MNKYSLVLLLILGSLLTFTSCRNDKMDPNSIFVDPKYEGGDPNSYSYLLDRWTFDNYVKPYNLRFLYRMEDVGTDMTYNLIPTSYPKAIDMAVLVKYLWVDVYAKVVGENLLKQYGPRIIHLIGSSEYNPANGTEVLGVAEGGLKITLTKCNQLDISNLEFANEQYFKTMHHEFAHILHQTKPYPPDFRLFSPAFYEPFNWQERTDQEARSLGFVSPYAGAAVQEDFVEVIANYIVKTKAQWDKILQDASVPSPDAAGVDGKAMILAKLDMCKTWLTDKWGINIDSLHEEVQRRQSNIPMDSLRKQLTADYPDINIH